MAKGMRAPSTNTGFLLPEDRLARRPLLATAAAREDNGTARAARIIVVNPGCAMAVGLFAMLGGEVCHKLWSVSSAVAVSVRSVPHPPYPPGPMIISLVSSHMCYFNISIHGPPGGMCCRPVTACVLARLCSLQSSPAIEERLGILVGDREVDPFMASSSQRCAVSFEY